VKTALEERLLSSLSAQREVLHFVTEHIISIIYLFVPHSSTGNREVIDKALEPTPPLHTQNAGTVCLTMIRHIM
jgi:hypothetical protein